MNSYILSFTTTERYDNMNKNEQIKQMLHDNFVWFLDNYNDIYNRYGVCYVIIKDKQIIGVYDDFTIALEETRKTEELGTFSLQFCNGDESGYTAYHY